MRIKGSRIDGKFFRSTESMIKFDEVFLIIVGNKWHKNGSRVSFFFSPNMFLCLLDVNGSFKARVL